MWSCGRLGSSRKCWNSRWMSIVMKNEIGGNFNFNFCSSRCCMTKTSRSSLPQRMVYSSGNFKGNVSLTHSLVRHALALLDWLHSYHPLLLSVLNNFSFSKFTHASHGVEARKDLGFFSVMLQSADDSCTSSSDLTIFRERRQCDSEWGAEFNCLIFTLHRHSSFFALHGGLGVKFDAGKGGRDREADYVG